MNKVCGYLVKGLIPFFLIALSSQAFGQIWEPVVESEEKSVYYYDPTTVKREGDIVTYWELSNYGVPLKSGSVTVISSKSKVIQDCKNGRYRIADLIDYDGPSGQGNIIYVAMLTMTNWYSSPVGSVNDAMRSKVCKDKT
jgi:hypothetical protein